jgi:PAS domain S-box-containing protein
MAGFLASNAICCVVIASLWLRYRGSYRGPGLWTVGFVLETFSVLVVGLQGNVPNFVSMVMGNALSILGAILVLWGLERYLDQRAPGIWNWAILALFMAVQTYFSIVQPDLVARTINLSIALMFVCAQGAWLMLTPRQSQLRPASRSTGLVLAAFAVTCAIRVPMTLILPPSNNFLRAGPVQALAVLVFQMLFIALTCSLLLMVNQRMATSLSDDIVRRKHLEDELHRSEEEFSVAFHNSPDAILLTSLEGGTIIDVNESFSDITGYSHDEAVGRTTVDVGIWPSQEERRARLAGLLAAQGGSQRLELEFPRRSGELFAGWISSQVVKLSRGMYVLSVLHDMSDQKRLEREIDRERKQLQAVFDSVPGILYLYDDQEKLVLWNRKHEELTGYSGDELAKMHLADGYREDEESLAAIRRAFHRTLAENSGDAEALLHCKDGSAIPMYFTAVRVEMDGRQYYTGIGVDITDRKQAEKALLESEQRYRLLFENMTTGFALHEIVYDERGTAVDYRFLAVNPAFERLTGVPASSLIGRTVLTALPGTERSWIDTYADVARTGIPRQLTDYSRFRCSVHPPAASPPSSATSRTERKPKRPCPEARHFSTRCRKLRTWAAGSMTSVPGVRHGRKRYAASMNYRSTTTPTISRTTSPSMRRVTANSCVTPSTGLSTWASPTTSNSGL